MVFADSIDTWIRVLVTFLYIVISVDLVDRIAPSSSNPQRGKEVRRNIIWISSVLFGLVILGPLVVLWLMFLYYIYVLPGMREDKIRQYGRYWRGK
jgi:phosphatidylserine synthase